MKRAFTLKQVWKASMEERYEHADKEFGKKFGYFSCSPTEFVIRNIIAWIFNLKCRACSNTGTYDGYEYQEGCDYCSMMAYRWNFNFWRWIKSSISYQKGYEDRLYYEFDKYEQQKLGKVS